MSRFIPNSFQVPNAFVDEFLDRISGNATKCYLVVARKTTGWQKVSDRISTDQFMKICGIKDKKTAYKALSELADVKLINVFKKQGEINEFSLNFYIEDDELKPVGKIGSSTKNSVEPVGKIGSSTSTKNPHSTKDTIKNNITNITLTGNNARTKKSSDFDLLDEFGIDGDLAMDFVKHRKALKAPITKTAMNGFQREANKAGIPIRQAVQIAVERGWRGFRADWDWQGGNFAKHSANPNAYTPPLRMNDPGCMAGQIVEIEGEIWEL